MPDIYKKITELQQSNVPAALVTVTKAKGSTPRNAGAKMIVQMDGTIFGTVGGSSVEAQVIEEAKECINKNVCRTVSHNLYDLEKNDTGMVCGGTMEFFIEPLAQSPNLYIFGGGHVAKPLARLAAITGFVYTLIDDREQFATSERFPSAKEILIKDPGKAATEIELKHSDFIAIVTRCHEQDYDTLKGVITKPFFYLGLIGSKAKRKQIFTRLIKEDGIDEKLLEKVHTPIGLKIKAETPEEIAVSIVAEMIQIKNQNK